MAAVLSLFLLIFLSLTHCSPQVRVEKSDIDILNGDYQYYALDSSTHENVYYQTKNKIYAIPQTYHINGTVMFLYVFSTKYPIDQSIDAYVITTAGPDTPYQIDVYEYYVYNGTSFIPDTDMNFFDTSDICISDIDKYGQYIDGTYTFDHYNYTRDSSIYRNIATDIYLYGWTIPNNTYPWILGPDYNALDPAVFCASTTTIYRYSTPIIDCDTWYIWSNITQEYQIDNNVTSEYCYDVSTDSSTMPVMPTVSVTSAPTVEPTNGGFSTTASPTIIISTSSTKIPTLHQIQTTENPTTEPSIQPTNGGFLTSLPTTFSISTTTKPTLPFPTKFPTPSPSNSPSEIPTYKPTPGPTSSPTPSPTPSPTYIITAFATTTEGPTQDPADGGAYTTYDTAYDTTIHPTYYISTTAQKTTIYPSIESTFHGRVTEAPTTEPSYSRYTSIPTRSDEGSTVYPTGSGGGSGGGKKSHTTTTSNDGVTIALIIIGIVIFIVVAGVVYKYMIAPKMNDKNAIITTEGYQNMNVLNEAPVSTVVVTQNVAPKIMSDKKSLIEGGVSDEVGEFMRNNKLEKYESGLRNIAGVECMDDLMDLEEDELKEVAVESGMNKGLYQNRFVKAVKALQIKKQRAGSIATPQYVHPQYQI